MTLNTGLFNLYQRVALRNGGVTLRAFYSNRHHIGLRFFLLKGFSPDELHLGFVTIGAFRCCLMVATQALHSCLEDLSVLLSGGMTVVAVQYSCNMLSVGKREVINLDLHVLKSLMTFATL